MPLNSTRKQNIKKGDLFKVDSEGRTGGFSNYGFSILNPKDILLVLVIKPL